MGKQARDKWVEKADKAISAEFVKEKKQAFPPLIALSWVDLVTGAWKSFHRLQGMRNYAAINSDLDLACAEHYAFARAMTCAGGIFLAVTTIDLAVIYQLVKRDAEFADTILGILLNSDDVGILQFVGRLFSLGTGRTTPPSMEQLVAAADGAADGLVLFSLAVH